MLNAPDPAPATSSTQYATAVMLVLPQVLASLFALLWLDFAGMAVAGCETRCDHAAADAAYIGLRIALLIITVLTLFVLVMRQKRGRKAWPIMLAGLALTILATLVASQVVDWAYSP
jgi:hypothetical protein